MSSLRKFFTGVGLVGLVVLAIPMAVLALEINIVGSGPYGGGGLTFFDNAPGDLDPSPLAITIIAGVSVPAIPGFNLSVNTATSNQPGGPISSFLDLTWNLQSTGTGGGAIKITATETGYTFPPDGINATLNSQLNGNISTAGGSVTGQQFIILEDGTVVTPGLQALNTAASVSFTMDAPFSLQEVLNLSITANSLTTGDFLSETGKIPEPISLILLGSGLAGAGLVRRFRKSK